MGRSIWRFTGRELVVDVLLGLRAGVFLTIGGVLCKGGLQGAEVGVGRGEGVAHGACVGGHGARVGGSAVKESTGGQR